MWPSQRRARGRRRRQMEERCRLEISCHILPFSDWLDANLHNNAVCERGKTANPNIPVKHDPPNPLKSVPERNILCQFSRA